MIDIKINSLLMLFLFPFFGTGILAAIISLVGRSPSNGILLSSATSIGVTWVCAFVLGIPDLSLSFHSNSIAHILIVGLILGALLDHFLPHFGNRHRMIGSTLDLLFAATVIFWIRGKADLFSFLIFVFWGSILISTRKHSNDARVPVIMMVVSSAGLATIAWIGNILLDRDLAFGVCSAGLGFGIWLLFRRDLPIGYSFYWCSFTSLLLIALRILDANPLMVAPIILLGFIFFSDSIISRAKFRSKIMEQFAAPLVVGALSLLPIILASASALVATTLLNN